jgi:RNA polymerase sigma-70 factor, ECF subfamily
VTRAQTSPLVARAKAGDKDAFERILALHAGRVYDALLHFGLTPTDAEDVAQEVFVRAWRGLARFEGRARLSTWLYRIAFNEAQRRLARRAPTPVVPDPYGSDPIAELADSPAQEPDAQTPERDFQGQLRLALAQLPVDGRAAVVLRDLEGLSTAEAAKIVGIRAAAFQSRLPHGRMQLRGLLSHISISRRPREEPAGQPASPRAHSSAAWGCAPTACATGAPSR